MAAMKVSSVLETKRHGNENDNTSGYGKAVFGNSVMENVVETHVLAVDDCIIDRKVIERLLRKDSVKVTAVESAARALEVLGVREEQPLMATSNDAFKFSMIITDYCMPGMTGYDLLKKLKEIKGLKEIPVVIMSSENVPQRIQRCLEEGAKDFIIKPVQQEDIEKLRGHIKVRQSTAVAAANVSSISACKKRKKMTSVGLAEENSERRHRVGRVVVA